MSSNPANNILVSKLQELLKSGLVKGGFRITAYRRAIQTIKDHPDAITNYSEAIAIKGIGKSLATKIQEILDSGNLEVLENIPDDVKIVKELQQVGGIGPVTAERLQKAGVTSIADLYSKIDDESLNLTDAIKMNLEAFKDIDKKMNFIQVEELGELVRKSLPGSRKDEPPYEILITGSYLRAKDNPNEQVLFDHKTKDADVAVFPRTREKYPEDLYEDIIERMKSILGPKSVKIISSGPDRILAIVRLADFWRRLDIFMAHKDEIGAAKLEHTGPFMFNINMRSRAREMGYSLKKDHLYKIDGENEIPLLELSTEALIFEKLKMPFVKPHERDEYKFVPL